MSERVPEVRRLWAVIKPGSAGREVLHLTAREPDCTNMSGVLLLTGMLVDDGLDLQLDLVSDPKQDPALTGPDGPNGWTPVLVPVADGTRTLIKVADWVRSSGKPATGFLSASGALTADPASAFNFNAVKRVAIFSGTTGSDGIATIAFSPAFSTVPATALPSAVPNVLTGPVKAELVAGTLAKDSCKVKVTAAALFTGVVAALAGATASVIVIEA